MSLRDVSERYYASMGRSILNALILLDACDGKPVIVVDRGLWYPWALNRLGIQYLQEKFGERNRIERWFRELKNRTKRFYNNIETVKSIEDIALIHNLLLNTQTKGGIIPS